MSDLEIITIMIGFYLGAHKTFKHYYQEIVCRYWQDLFLKKTSLNLQKVDDQQLFWDFLKPNSGYFSLNTQ